MKLFLKYLAENKAFAVLFLLFSGIFIGIFTLYNIEIEAVVYAFVLCMAILVVTVAVRFIIYRRKYLQRQRVKRNIEIITEKLPAPTTLTEKDYTEIIDTLREILTARERQYAAAYSDSLDYFTTWVHLIKTPISVISMNISKEDTEENRLTAAEIFKIEQYVQMALNYIRLDAKENDFLFKEIPLDSVIREAIRKFAPQFIHKKLSVNYSGTDITVLSDKKWLLFIIEQILSNAVKYTDKGGVTITVSGDKKLTVADTGIGISAEDLPRIFEKGYTGFTGREENKSTGLGLYLCKKTADKLGIEISAFSEIGKGTEFTIDLAREEISFE